MKNTKIMYVIYDHISEQYGDVLALDNDNEAKRLFIKNCANCGFSDDLELFAVGEISINDTSELKVPFVSNVETRLVCAGSDVREELEEEIKKNAEIVAINNAVTKTYSDSNFVENVAKLCRYFSKKDKRFGK